MSEKKIKIAMISQSMQIGGGEIMAAKLSGYIDDNKFDIKLFIIGEEKDNLIKKILKINKINYTCLNLPTKFDIKSYKKFSKNIKEYAPDIIHVHLDYCYSWIWCILNKCPMIVTMHSDPYRRRSFKVGLLIKLKVLQRNIKVIGCSKKTAELVSLCYKIPRKYISYIYNPIDLEKYNLKKNNSKMFNFVHIGRFDPVKNHRMLINAFAKAFKGDNKVFLHLAGDGELKNKIKDEVITLGVSKQVIFHGNVEDIPAFLKKMDVLVLSSYSEAFPMSILEGMASGLPIIATKVGGIPEIINNNGILVNINDEKSFSKAMVKLKNDSKLRNYYSNMSLSNIKNYDKRVISKAYENEYMILGEQNENR